MEKDAISQERAGQCLEQIELPPECGHAPPFWRSQEEKTKIKAPLTGRWGEALAKRTDLHQHADSPPSTALASKN